MDARPFQIILMGIFLALAIGGIIAFATFRGFGSDVNPYGDRVDVWGTLEEGVFVALFDEVKTSDRDFEVVRYRQFDARTFESELVNALAEGTGPDLVVMPQDMLVAERAKLIAIPYDTLPVRTFRDSYVDGAEAFLGTAGVYGIPFAVDPLVMYWNKDIFATAGLANPPATWEELVAKTVPGVIQRSPSLDITRAAIAFGEYANVQNAKEVLALLLLQTGSRLVFEGERGYEVSLNTPTAAGTGSGDAAVRFYTEFANPAKTTYSWNRALPADINEFLAGDLALYFGFGSEVNLLRNANPNLNFDAAEVPQGAGATAKKGYGTFYAFAIPKGSDNSGGAYLAAMKLGAVDVSAKLANRLGFAPVHRSVIAGGDSNPLKTILFRSALVARGFLDPNAGASENVFKEMIEDVSSGRRTIHDAVGDAEVRLRQLIQ